MPPRGVPASEPERATFNGWESSKRLEPGGALCGGVPPSLPSMALGEAWPLRAWMRAQLSAMKSPDLGESTGDRGAEPPRGEAVEGPLLPTASNSGCSLREAGRVMLPDPTESRPN